MLTSLFILIMSPVKHLAFAFALLFSITARAQRIADYELYSSNWMIVNTSIDSSTIFNQDTLILRQTFIARKQYYQDTSASQYGVWRIHFGEFNDLSIFRVERPPSGVPHRANQYTTHMFPCVNQVWRRKRKELIMRIGFRIHAVYKIVQFSDHELVLVKQN